MLLLLLLVSHLTLGLMLLALLRLLLLLLVSAPWLVDVLLARVQVLAKHAGSAGLSAKHAEKVVKP